MVRRQLRVLTEKEAKEADERRARGIVGKKVSIAVKGSIQETKKKKKASQKVKMLRVIKKLQESTKHQITKAGFTHLVRGVVSDYKTDVRMREEALDAFQTGAEDWMIKLLTAAGMITRNRRQVTLKARDIYTALDAGSILHVPESMHIPHH
jgi:histone H3/H4